MSTHNTDITAAFVTSNGTFASQNVLKMDFTLLSTEMASIGTDLDTLMGRVQVFDTIAEATASTIDTTVGAVIVCGHTTLGDMSPALFDNQGSAPAHNGYFTSNGGTRYWVYIPSDGIVSCAPFGAIPGFAAAANTTAFNNWDGFINQGNYQRGIIPPGDYDVNGNMATFTVSRFHIEAHGVNITQNSTTAVTVDLNGGALADESVITSYITWEGGRFVHAVAYATTPNTATAIRARGITRCTIANVEVTQFGTGFALNPRDALTLRDCHGFQNNVHVNVADFQSATQNPQGLKFEGFCGWSVHYDAGIKIDGSFNEATIDGFYATGSRAIVIENASSVGSNNTITIASGGFEQGQVTALTGTWTLGTGSATITAASDGAATTEIAAQDRIWTAGGNVYTVSSVTDDDTIVLTANPTANESSITIYQAQPYIDIRDTNAGTLTNLTIKNCAFGAFTGTTTLAQVLHCRSATNVSIENIRVSSRGPGWLWFDSSCSKIHLKNITETGTANYIHYDCDREDITYYPQVIDFNGLNGSNGNLIESNTSKSTSDDGTIDMSAQISAAYYPTVIHPKGYDFQLAARDSGSAGSSTCWYHVVPTSSVASGERFRWPNVELNGITNDVRQQGGGYCKADANGDVYVRHGATGASTMDVYLTVTRMWM